jgi:hypothetical protein
MIIRLYIDAKIRCIIMIHGTLVDEITKNIQLHESERLYKNIAKANIDEKK